MKILICGDGDRLRDGLGALSLAEPFDVVGQTRDTTELLELAQQSAADLALIDLSLPEVDGVDAARQLRAAHPKVKVIAVASSADTAHLRELFAAGALGYVFEHSLGAELPEALVAVLGGRPYLSPHAEHALAPAAVREQHALAPPKSANGHSSGKTLSARERQVLQLLADGKSSKQIAACLHIAVTTVETHRRQIMDKVGLRTIAELTKYAVRVGLTSLE